MTESLHAFFLNNVGSQISRLKPSWKCLLLVLQ
jgi:hypothetical protein